MKTRMLGWWLGWLIIGLGTGTGWTKFLKPDVEKVPVDRLVANLEKQVETNPKSLESRYALARVHSIAYALKEGELPVQKQGGKPFFGHGPAADFPPREVRAVGGSGGTTHLQRAIEQYREALKLSAMHLPSRLGLAWCLDQAGEKQAAVAAYREALALAWEKEEKQDHIFVATMTEEIARYLVPLLDPKQDAVEIENVKRYQQVIRKKPRAITPLVVPLTAQVELESLVNPAASVKFDLDGNSQDRLWAWIHPNAAWLVSDPKGDGQIGSGLQLFGNVTFWVFWENGYHALAALDDNHDGWLRDAELAGLGLWRDLNGNGLSDAGEVQAVSAWGITALSCQHITHRTGIAFNPRGVLFGDGSARPTYDWIARAVMNDQGPRSGAHGPTNGPTR